MAKRSILKAQDNYLGEKEYKESKSVRFSSNKKTVLLLADSFGQRISPYLGEAEPFDIYNYNCPVGHHDIGGTESTFRVMNRSRGGRKLVDGFSQSLVEEIMHYKPSCIVVMAGMCDVASMTSNDHNSHWFYDTVINVGGDFRAKANLLAQDDTDREYVENIILHVAFLQNWGVEYTPRQGCVSPYDASKIRSVNMKFAKRNVVSLFKEHNILLVDLCVPNPGRDDNLHYDSVTSSKLADRFILIAMRYLCIRRNCRNRTLLHRDALKSCIEQRAKDLVEALSCNDQ